MPLDKRYERLAEQIFFCGLTPGQLWAKGGRLKEGKSFSDIQKALLDGRAEGLGEIDRELMCIAEKLAEVVNFV